jgi:hypothetical protein
MIRLIKSIYEAAVARHENESAQFTAESRMVTEASQIVVDRPDKDGWVKAFGANDQEKGLVQSNHLEMIRKAREFARFDPNAKAGLSTLVNYIMGKGLTITPKSDDPLVWYVWKEFVSCDRNKWALKQFEIILRTLRDGELFVEFFTENEDGESTGKTSIRFVDPLMVRANDADPKPAGALPDQETIHNGVVTDPEDVEKIIKYTVQKRGNPNEFREVLAEDMLHVKINVDSDQKRGETQLLAVMNMVKHYQQWIENRIILNKMRSAIVLIKKVTGTPSEVAAMANTLPTVRSPAGDSKRQNIRGGQMITAGPGVEYEMLSANLNAQDAKEDGRNIKLNIAAGMNLPEYVFGDASNNNFASSLIAEAPFVKAVQFWQIFFEYYIGQIYRRVIQNAVDSGMLEAPDDEEFVNQLKELRPQPLTEAFKKISPDRVPPVPQSAGAANDPTAQEVDSNGNPVAPQQQPPAAAEPVDPAEAERQAKLAELMPNGKMETPSEIFFGCDMAWPEIVHREIKQQVDALSIARQNGWIADSTATSALGYDYAEEVRKQMQIEEEAAQKGNPLMNASAGDITGDSSTMDADMEDMLNTLSPEERDQVLKAKDPREVVKIMGRKNAAAAAGADQGGNN